MLLRFLGFLVLMVSGIAFSRNSLIWDYNAQPGKIDSSLAGLRPELIVPQTVFQGTHAIVLPFWYDESKRSPLIEKTWSFNFQSSFRFHCALDTVVILDTVSWARNRTQVLLPIATLMVADSQTLNGDQILLALMLLREKNGWRFCYHLTHPLDNSLWQEKLSASATPGTPYCFEFFASLNRDSLLQSLEVRMNGKPEGRFDVSRFRYKIRKWFMAFGIEEPKYVCKGGFYIDHIAQGTDWLGDPPRRPVLSAASLQKSGIQNPDLMLFSSGYRPFLVPSAHYATRYQIQSSGNAWELPLFDSGIDSLHKDSLLVKNFPLAPKTAYSLRIRHYDTSGNASAWSQPAALPRSPGFAPLDTSRVPGILYAHFTRSGSQAPLKNLIAGEWYDLVFRLSKPAVGWRDIAYALFWCNNTENALGTISNRGGAFNPANNYIFNFSISGQPVLFEKVIPGAYIFAHLPAERVGLNMDPRPSSYRIDTLSGVIRCRVRFLPEAHEGAWSLRGYATNHADVASSLFYSTFSLKKGAPAHAAKRRYAFWLAGLLTALLGITGVLFALRKRRGQNPKAQTREQEVVRKFEAYVRNNLATEFSIKDIETHMNMGHSNLYRIIKTVSGKSLKDIIIACRIEKAKELLKLTNLNITEVMQQSGFKDSAHFSNTFKKTVGESPRRYRGSLR